MAIGNVLGGSSGRIEEKVMLIVRVKHGGKVPARSDLVDGSLHEAYAHTTVTHAVVDVRIIAAVSESPRAAHAFGGSG